MRLYVALFLTFLAPNVLLVGPAFGLLGQPPDLANPFVDGLLEMAAPFALVVVMVQFPAWAIVDVLERAFDFELPTLLILASALSAAFYTGVVVWVRQARRYRGKRLWAEYRRGP